MKLFCCFTPAHEVLLKSCFLPSVPATFAVTAVKLEIEGAGDFLSAEFLQCILQKIELILTTVRENPGEVIVWSDIDIQFFDLDPQKLLLELGEHDIAFQREGPSVQDVNTGFFICRCNAVVEKFFEQVREGLERDASTNEQYFINRLLRDGLANISWSYLPPAYYARTHGWPPPRRMALYHANATAGPNGVQRKMEQFRELAFLRRFGILALVWTSLKYAPKRISRIVRQRFTRAQG